VTIDGHPELETENPQVMITVCSECGFMRSILFLVGDRWYCTKCKKEGTAAPTVIPLTGRRARRAVTGKD